MCAIKFSDPETDNLGKGLKQTKDMLEMAY